MAQSSTRGQKRKSNIAPSASDDEQLAAEKKRMKKTKSADPSNPCPAPRPTNRVLKAQLAASGRKPMSVSESGAAIETATRKRPAAGEVVDEAPVSGPPSKKVRGTSNTNANKSRILKRTGSFFTSELEVTC